MNNLLLITNNENIIEEFGKRLVLLRNTDRMYYCDYEDAPDIVFTNNPDIIIIHEIENFDKTLNLIKYIKTKKSNVLLLLNAYNRNSVLGAYDAGIDDYFLLDSDPSEILIRTVNCISKRNMEEKIEVYAKHLKDSGILSDTSGVYSKKAAESICEEEFQTKDYTQGALIVVAADENIKSNFSAKKMLPAIKNSVRNNDIIINAGGTRFCIINKDAGLDGAISIIEKIRNYLNSDISIKAGVCEIKKLSYNLALKKAQCALADALLGHQDTVIYAKNNNDYTDDWLDTPASINKNFKIFKQAFQKKLENVIAPVFYRVQKSCEMTMGNTKIEQYADELQSVFRLSTAHHTSLLKIVYPGMAKVNILITHAGLDSPENKEMSVKINKLTTQSLTDILENFIEEFKTIL